MSESIEICRKESITNEKSGCHREVPSQLNDRGSFHNLPNTLSWTLEYSTNIPVPFTFQGASGGKWLSYPALDCFTLRATNILDKSQGSFQNSVILFKSVKKASLILLLNAACFLVVASRGNRRESLFGDQGSIKTTQSTVSEKGMFSCSALTLCFNVLFND